MEMEEKIQDMRVGTPSKKGKGSKLKASLGKDRVYEGQVPSCSTLQSSWAGLAGTELFAQSSA